MELFNNHTALIIIDMQKAFVEPGAPLCVKGAKATVPACAKTIEEARTAGSPVIWVKRHYSLTAAMWSLPVIRPGKREADL